MKIAKLAAAAALAALIAACESEPPPVPLTALETEKAAEAADVTVALEKTRLFLRYNPKQPTCSARAVAWGEEPISMSRLKSSSGNLETTHPAWKANVVHIRTEGPQPVDVAFVPATDEAPFDRVKGIKGTWEVQSPSDRRVPTGEAYDSLLKGMVKANSQFLFDDLNNVAIRVIGPWFKADPPADKVAACEANKAACPCVATEGDLPAAPAK